MTGQTAICPLCGDYTGKPESVEAHITGKSDDTHRGHFGAEFRNEIGTGTASREAEDSSGTETASWDAKDSPEPSDAVSPVSSRDDSLSNDTERNEEGSGLALLFFIGAVVWFVLRNQRTPSQDEYGSLSRQGPYR